MAFQMERDHDSYWVALAEIMTELAQLGRPDDGLLNLAGDVAERARAHYGHEFPRGVILQ